FIALHFFGVVGINRFIFFLGGFFFFLIAFRDSSNLSFTVCHQFLLVFIIGINSSLTCLIFIIHCFLSGLIAFINCFIISLCFSKTRFIFLLNLKVLCDNGVCGFFLRFILS